MRMNEPGWIRIGRDIRRSLWLRVVEFDESTWDAARNRLDQIEAFELCAGREGDDTFVRIDRSNALWAELGDLLLTVGYGVDLEVGTKENST